MTNIFRHWVLAWKSRNTGTDTSTDTSTDSDATNDVNVQSDKLIDDLYHQVIKLNGTSIKDDNDLHSVTYSTIQYLKSWALTLSTSSASSATLHPQMNSNRDQTAEKALKLIVLFNHICNDTLITSENILRILLCIYVLCLRAMPIRMSHALLILWMLTRYTTQTKNSRILDKFQGNIYNLMCLTLSICRKHFPSPQMYLAISYTAQVGRLIITSETFSAVVPSTLNLMIKISHCLDSAMQHNLFQSEAASNDENASLNTSIHHSCLTQQNKSRCIDSTHFQKKRGCICGKSSIEQCVQSKKTLPHLFNDCVIDLVLFFTECEYIQCPHLLSFNHFFTNPLSPLLQHNVLWRQSLCLLLAHRRNSSNFKPKNDASARQNGKSAYKKFVNVMQAVLSSKPLSAVSKAELSLRRTRDILALTMLQSSWAANLCGYTCSSESEMSRDVLNASLLQLNSAVNLDPFYVEILCAYILLDSFNSPCMHSLERVVSMSKVITDTCSTSITLIACTAAAIIDSAQPLDNGNLVQRTSDRSCLNEIANLIESLKSSFTQLDEELIRMIKYSQSWLKTVLSVGTNKFIQANKRRRINWTQEVALQLLSSISDVSHDRLADASACHQTLVNECSKSLKGIPVHSLKAFSKSLRYLADAVDASMNDSSGCASHTAAKM